MLRLSQAFLMLKQRKSALIIGDEHGLKEWNRGG